MISATVTPLLENGALDKEGLKKIFERNIAHGVDGIFILGSMGEWGSFSDDFKEELVSESSRITGKLIAVCPGHPKNVELAGKLLAMIKSKEIQNQ